MLSCMCLVIFQEGILWGIPRDSRGDSRGIQGDSGSLLGDPRFLVVKKHIRIVVSGVLENPTECLNYNIN